MSTDRRELIAARDFGRRLSESKDGSLPHGYTAAMMLLGSMAPSDARAVGRPVYPVSAILAVPATKDLLVPIVRTNIPAFPSRVLPLGRLEPLEILHARRDVIVPDYIVGGYVDQTQVKLPDVTTNRLTETIAVQASRGRFDTLRREHGGSAITTAVKEETNRETRERIIELTRGLKHKIRRTFRVGRVQATEVIPERQTDPLLCARISDSSLDGTMNGLFELAFVEAMAGRISGDRGAIKRAAKLGRIAGRTAFNNCCGGEDWMLGELLFVSEIVYGRRLTNGFTTGFAFFGL